MDPRLSRFTGALPPLALGVSLLLALSYLSSTPGLACPTLDRTLVTKTVLAPLGLAGALFWSLLLLISSAGVKARGAPSALLMLSAPLALLASLLANTPLPLAAATLIVSLFWLHGGIGRLPLALSAGVCAIEALVIAYLLSWAAGAPLLLSAAWPLHFSLYCFLTPVMPPIVALSLLSPLLHPLVKGDVRFPSLRFLGSKSVLAAAIGACLMLWLVLYTSSLNPGAKLVGVDSKIRYYPHALVLLRDGAPAVLRVGYDRPLSYLILLWLAARIGPFEAVKALPLISLALYVVACHTAARELWGKRVAGLAALLAPLSYTTTAGLFGGLFNNWFSLSLALLAAAALARWQRTGRVFWIPIFLLLLALAAAAHVYMGAVAFAVFTLLLFVQIVVGPRRRGAAALVIAQLVLLTVGLNAADTLIGGSGGQSPTRALRTLTDHWLRTMARRPLFSAAWWDDYSFAVFNYAATAALDPTVWLLTAIAAAIAGSRWLGGPLMTCWLAVIAALSFLSPREYIFRALFDFPYPLAEAVATAHITGLIERKWGARTATLWLAALLLFKLAYTVTFACGLAVGS